MDSQDYENVNQTRSELFTEYLTLTEIIHKYDDYFIRIKTWGVTVSGITVIHGIKEASAWIVFCTLILSISFWITEAIFKVLQQDHILRLSELENTLSDNSVNLPHPRIFRALKEQKHKNKERNFWKSAMFWNHVMYPHIIFTLLGFSAGTILLFYP